MAEATRSAGALSACGRKEGNSIVALGCLLSEIFRDGQCHLQRAEQRASRLRPTGRGVLWARGSADAADLRAFGRSGRDQESGDADVARGLGRPHGRRPEQAFGLGTRRALTCCERDTQVSRLATFSLAAALFVRRERPPA